MHPSRVTAAKQAATTFVEGLTPGNQPGLATFGSVAAVLVSPTTDRRAVIEAITTIRLP